MGAAAAVKPSHSKRQAVPTTLAGGEAVCAPKAQGLRFTRDFWVWFCLFEYQVPHLKKKNPETHHLGGQKTRPTKWKCALWWARAARRGEGGLGQSGPEGWAWALKFPEDGWPWANFSLRQSLTRRSTNTEIGCPTARSVPLPLVFELAGSYDGPSQARLLFGRGQAAKLSEPLVPNIISTHLPSGQEWVYW